MPRSCSICSDPKKARRVAEMVAEGATDAAIAAAVGASRPAVNRHRRGHIVKPTQDALAIADKGAVSRQERQQLAQAAAADTPAPAAVARALLSLDALADRLAGIEARLERAAGQAEATGALTSLAGLAGQQIRAVEATAKLGGVGGYAPRKDAGSEPGQPFVLNINFSNGQKVTVEGRPVGEDPATIEQEVEEPADDNCLL